MKPQAFIKSQIDTLSVRDYLNRVDTQNFLWRDNGALYSVACKKAEGLPETNKQEIFERVVENLIRYECLWHGTRENSAAFLGSKIIRCKTDSCTMKF